DRVGYRCDRRILRRGHGYYRFAPYLDHADEPHPFSPYYGRRVPAAERLLHHCCYLPYELAPHFPAHARRVSESEVSRICCCCSRARRDGSADHLPTRASERAGAGIRCCDIRRRFRDSDRVDAQFSWVWRASVDRKLGFDSFQRAPTIAERLV